jgi:hypothetical protein
MDVLEHTHAANRAIDGTLSLGLLFPTAGGRGLTEIINNAELGEDETRALLLTIGVLLLRWLKPEGAAGRARLRSGAWDGTRTGRPRRESCPVCL